MSFLHNNIWFIQSIQRPDPLPGNSRESGTVMKSLLPPASLVWTRRNANAFRRIVRWADSLKEGVSAIYLPTIRRNLPR